MIILATHSPEYAASLKCILELHGISVSLSSLEGDNGSALGVQVSVDEKDIPLAIKIIESGVANRAKEERKLTGVSNILLIPVDFSDMSILACRAGFEFALRLNLRPLLLFACANPYEFNSLRGLEGFDALDTPGLDDTEVAVESDTILRDASKMMRKFKEKIRQLQSSGSLPVVDFDTDVEEGVAEDVIINYTRQNPPALVVMATRGKHKREKEMVGSVTAEVLDSCRVPVFTVPEFYSFCGVRNIVRLAFFCNLDRQDVFSVDTLMRMFSFPAVDVWLVPVNDRAGDNISKNLDSLRDYFAKNYPTASFHAAHISQKNIRNDFEKLVADNNLQMIIVPNKKKNIISRLFNPGIAHRILFEKDIPMLALPV